ncbi:MAG: alpha/beta fold hydrolase [Verrucomicrobiales bacterium]|nr:alpha/beta fold hydrolase [Verrucomicrobiales bacterium]
MKKLKGIEGRHELEWLGETVYTEFHATEESVKGTVLILHGLGDHIGRYAWALELLLNAGYSVLGIDWPGCGNSSGIRGNLPRVDEAERLVGEILEKAEIDPVGVLGHSTGGFYLVQFLVRGLPALSSLKWVWFSSPLLDPVHGQNPLKVFAAKLLVKVIPTFTLSTGVYPRDCFHTGGGPRSGNFAEGCHNRISLRFGEDLLDEEKIAVASAGKIRADLKILVTQGAADHVCSPKLTEPFVNQLKAKSKAFLLISGSRHEPFREPESAPFFNHVRTWLSGRV